MNSYVPIRKTRGRPRTRVQAIPEVDLIENPFVRENVLSGIQRVMTRHTNNYDKRISRLNDIIANLKAENDKLKEDINKNEMSTRLKSDIHLQLKNLSDNVNNKIKDITSLLVGNQEHNDILVDITVPNSPLLEGTLSVCVS